MLEACDAAAAAQTGAADEQKQQGVHDLLHRHAGAQHAAAQHTVLEVCAAAVQAFHADHGVHHADAPGTALDHTTPHPPDLKACAAVAADVVWGAGAHQQHSQVEQRAVHHEAAPQHTVPLAVLKVCAAAAAAAAAAQQACHTRHQQSQEDG